MGAGRNIYLHRGGCSFRTGVPGALSPRTRGQPDASQPGDAHGSGGSAARDDVAPPQRHSSLAPPRPPPRGACSPGPAGEAWCQLTVSVDRMPPGGLALAAEARADVRTAQDALVRLIGRICRPSLYGAFSATAFAPYNLGPHERLSHGRTFASISVFQLGSVDICREQVVWRPKGSRTNLRLHPSILGRLPVRADGLEPPRLGFSEARSQARRDGPRA